MYNFEITRSVSDGSRLPDALLDRVKLEFINQCEDFWLDDFDFLPKVPAAFNQNLANLCKEFNNTVVFDKNNIISIPKQYRPNETLFVWVTPPDTDETSAMYGMRVGGSQEQVHKFVAKFNEFIYHDLLSITQLVTSGGGTYASLNKFNITFKENELPIQLFYPFLKGPMEELWDDYLNGRETVLLLIGPPGTGKSTFTRGFINHARWNTFVCADLPLIQSGEVFRALSRKGGSNYIACIEECDKILGKREDGAETMSTILDFTNGILPSEKHKVVLSTNLSNIRNIDSALYRPCRCFDVIEFRNLTIAEARAIEDYMGLAHIDYGGKEVVPLAEVLAPRRKSRAINPPVFGFA